MKDNSLEDAFYNVIKLCERSMQEYGDIGDDEALNIVRAYYLLNVIKE